MYTESVFPEGQTVSEILWRIGDQAVPYGELPERNQSYRSLVASLWQFCLFCIFPLRKGLPFCEKPYTIKRGFQGGDFSPVASAFWLQMSLRLMNTNTPAREALFGWKTFSQQK
ncbi:Uncharacterized protein APZ42_005725, partial [Daphnia magna]